MKKIRTSGFRRRARLRVPVALSPLSPPGVAVLLDGRHVPTATVIEGGRYNVYDCEWGHALLSLDLDQGVTPAFVGCPFEGSLAGSRFYRVPTPAQHLPVAMVWRKPTPGEVKRERRRHGDRGHFASGGLAREWVANAKAALA